MRRIMMKGVCGIGVALTLGGTPACGGKKDAPPAAAETEQPGTPVLDEVDAAVKAEVERVAKIALTAYRDKNLEALAAVGPPDAKERLIFIEPRNPNYERLLGDSTWRMRALKAWDGELKGFRIGEDVAQVYFAKHPDDPDKRVIAIELLKNKTSGEWQFNDLIEQDRGLYTRSTMKIDLSNIKIEKKAPAPETP